MTSSSPPHVVQSILEQFTNCFNPTYETDGVGVGSSGGKGPNISPTPRSSQHDRLDVDVVVAKAKTAASIPSPEILEEKSYKRKLEIFRIRTAPGVDRQRAKMSNDLVEDPLSDSDSTDEEIKNLIDADETNRFACGGFHLCFATPVRAASPEAEDVETLSDDCLTAEDEEFLFAFYARSSSAGANDLFIDEDSLEGISEDGEKTVETADSTLYFESKYNTFTQTSPPMPLFASQSISVTPTNTSGIYQMIKRRYEETHKHKSPKRRAARRNISPQKRNTKSHHLALRRLHTWSNTW